MSRTGSLASRRGVQSPERLYHPVPHSPVAVEPLVASIRLEADGEDEDQDDDYIADEMAASITLPAVDKRIEWIHFILGASVLLPWNAIITATPFFMTRLVGSHLRTSFSSWLTSSFTAINLVCLAHATLTTKQALFSTRIILPLLWITGLSFLLTLSTLVPTSPGIFFTFVLLNGMGQSAAGSYFQSTIIAVASLFGPGCVQKYVSGQAAVAVVVSGLQVTSAAASLWTTEGAHTVAEESDGAAEARGAFLFFGISTLFLLFSLAAYMYLMRLPVYQAIVAPVEAKKTLAAQTHREPGETQGLVVGGPSTSWSTSWSEESFGQIIRIAKANVLVELSLALDFMVSLAVFPAITASIQPTNPRTSPFLFVSIHFLMFAIGDLLGRYLCDFPRFLIWSTRKLLVLSASRVIFIFLFLLCNVQRPGPDGSGTYTPFINSDWMFQFIVLLFGTTNGYVASMGLIAAPSVEHNPALKGRREDVDTAATVAVFTLVGGLATGSMLSFAVRSAICGGCNPFTE